MESGRSVKKKKEGERILFGSSFAELFLGLPDYSLNIYVESFRCHEINSAAETQVAIVTWNGRNKENWNVEQIFFNKR